MEYRKAVRSDSSAILALVRDTVCAVYPRYYPQGVVEYFLAWHTEERIAAAVEAGQVDVLLDDSGRLVGTGSREENLITRVYVLPSCQGQGYGSAILSRLEEAVGRAWSTARLDASLPAVELYERRGYHTVGHQSEKTENGCVLVWDVMEKRLWED